MKTMWAPWRMEYILGEKEKGCIFCRALSDQGNLILYKGKVTMVVMNKYPYINGHLLVAPTRHLSLLEQLSKNEMGDLLETVEKSVGILKKVMNPDGFNVGLNLGKVAGAGVEKGVGALLVVLVRLPGCRLVVEARLVILAFLPQEVIREAEVGIETDPASRVALDERLPNLERLFVLADFETRVLR